MFYDNKNVLTPFKGLGMSLESRVKEIVMDKLNVVLRGNRRRFVCGKHWRRFTGSAGIGARLEDEFTCNLTGFGDIQTVGKPSNISRPSKTNRKLQGALMYENR